MSDQTTDGTLVDKPVDDVDSILRRKQEMARTQPDVIGSRALQPGSPESQQGGE